MIVKSPANSLDVMTRMVRENHPYKVVEVISSLIQAANPDYIEYMRDVTKRNKH